MKKCKLGDICEVQAGGTPSRSNPEYWNGGSIPWVKISDFSGKHLFYTEECITESGLKNSSAKIFPSGSILYSIFASLGEVTILDIDACTNQAIAGITVRDKSYVNRDYIYYYLKSIKNKVSEMGRGVAQNNINLSMLRGFEFNIPSLKEQELAVERLCKAEINIENRKTQLELLDTLIKARFVEMFGMPVSNSKGFEQTTLIKVLAEGRTVSYGIVQTGDDVDGGVPVFRPIDIAGGHVPTRKQLKCTLPEISNKYKRTLLKGNELLITVRGSVGETFQTTEEFEGCNVGRNIVPLLTDSTIVNQRFLQELFANDEIKNWLRGITKGIALQGLNMSEFQEMPVVVPPIELQDSYVEFAHRVDKSKAVVQKALEEAQLLFDSLMQEYFG